MSVGKRNGKHLFKASVLDNHQTRIYGDRHRGRTFPFINLRVTRVYQIRPAEVIKTPTRSLQPPGSGPIPRGVFRNSTQLKTKPSSFIFSPFFKMTADQYICPNILWYFFISTGSVFYYDSGNVGSHPIASHGVKRLEPDQKTIIGKENSEGGSRRAINNSLVMPKEQVGCFEERETTWNHKQSQTFGISYINEYTLYERSFSIPSMSLSYFGQTNNFAWIRFQQILNRQGTLKASFFQYQCYASEFYLRNTLLFQEFSLIFQNQQIGQTSVKALNLNAPDVLAKDTLQATAPAKRNFCRFFDKETMQEMLHKAKPWGKTQSKPEWFVNPIINRLAILKNRGFFFGYIPAPGRVVSNCSVYPSRGGTNGFISLVDRVQNNFFRIKIPHGAGSLPRVRLHRSFKAERGGPIKKAESLSSRPNTPTIFHCIASPSVKRLEPEKNSKTSNLKGENFEIDHSGESGKCFDVLDTKTQNFLPFSHDFNHVDILSKIPKISNLFFQPVSYKLSSTEPLVRSSSIRTKFLLKQSAPKNSKTERSSLFTMKSSFPNYACSMGLNRALNSRACWPFSLALSPQGKIGQRVRVAPQGEHGGLNEKSLHKSSFSMAKKQNRVFGLTSRGEFIINSGSIFGEFFKHSDTIELKVETKLYDNFYSGLSIDTKTQTLYGSKPYLFSNSPQGYSGEPSKRSRSPFKFHGMNKWKMMRENEKPFDVQKQIRPTFPKSYANKSLSSHLSTFESIPKSVGWKGSVEKIIPKTGFAFHLFSEKRNVQPPRGADFEDTFRPNLQQKNLRLDSKNAQAPNVSHLAKRWGVTQGFKETTKIVATHYQYSISLDRTYSLMLRYLHETKRSTILSRFIESKIPAGAEFLARRPEGGISPVAGRNNLRPISWLHLANFHNQSMVSIFSNKNSRVAKPTVANSTVTDATVTDADVWLSGSSFRSSGGKNVGKEAERKGPIITAGQGSRLRPSSSAYISPLKRNEGVWDTQASRFRESNELKSATQSFGLTCLISEFYLEPLILKNVILNSPKNNSYQLQTFYKSFFNQKSGLKTPSMRFTDVLQSIFPQAFLGVESLNGSVTLPAGRDSSPQGGNFSGSFGKQAPNISYLTEQWDERRWEWYTEIYNFNYFWHFISFKFDIVISRNLNHFRNARSLIKKINHYQKPKIDDGLNKTNSKYPPRGGATASLNYNQNPAGAGFAEKTVAVAGFPEPPPHPERSRTTPSRPLPPRRAEKHYEPKKGLLTPVFGPTPRRGGSRFRQKGNHKGRPYLKYGILPIGPRRSALKGGSQTHSLRPDFKHFTLSKTVGWKPPQKSLWLQYLVNNRSQFNDEIQVSWYGSTGIKSFSLEQPIINLQSSYFDAFQINTFNQIYFINAVASLSNVSKSSDITQGVPLLRRYFDLPKDSPIHLLLKQTFEKYYSYSNHQPVDHDLKASEFSTNPPLRGDSGLKGKPHYVFNMEAEAVKNMDVHGQAPNVPLRAKRWDDKWWGMKNDEGSTRFKTGFPNLPWVNNRFDSNHLKSRVAAKTVAVKTQWPHPEEGFLNTDVSEKNKHLASVFKNSSDNQFAKNALSSHQSPIKLEGSLKLRTIALKSSLIKILQKIVNNVQAVYRGQGVEIYDQHIEVLVSQMGSKIRVKEDFDSKFFWNEIVPLNLIKDNTNIEFEPIICGITKISLQTDSFISAASFQSSSKILSQESLKKSKDFIFGLKESIIVSELIPSGTGVFSIFG